MSEQQTPSKQEPCFPYLRFDPQRNYWFDGCKFIYHQDRLQEWLDGARIAPVHIDMGIHKACNIRCRYCYGVYQKPSREYIPEANLINLANDAKILGVRSIAIVGDGEPTLNQGLYAFVEECKKVRLDAALATNGLLLDESRVRILTQSLVYIRFNVSGVDKYEYVMGAPKGGFKRFEKAVTLAVKHRGECTIGLQMVLTPDCFSEVVPLAKRAVEWGVDYLVIKQFSDPEERMITRFDMDEYAKVTDNLKRAEGMSNERTAIVVKWSALKDTKDITKHKRWSFDRCVDLPFIFQISGNGKCYPCGYLFGHDEYCYGDVSKERLRDILISEKYWGIVEKVGLTPLRKLCKGQCRHCETNKFAHQLLAQVNGKHHDLRGALVKMCGGMDNYVKLLMNPPKHINFL